MQFIQILTSIFSNIFLAFKNFFHWTISRIIIVIFSFFLAVVSFLPFFLIVVILWYIDAINWGDTFVSFSQWTQFFWLLSAFSTSPFFFILEWLIVIVWIAFAIGVFWYKSVLVYRLLNSYIHWEKIRLKENLHIWFLKKYITVFPRIFFYLSLPVFGYIVYFFLIVLVFWGFENILYTIQKGAINSVSISLAIGFVIALLSFIYIYYRLIFSYIHLVKNPDLSWKELIHHSRVSTRWLTIFSILWIVFVYGILTFPTGSFESYSKNSSDDMWKYLFYRSLESIPAWVSFESLGLTSYKNYEELELTPSFLDLDAKYRKYELEVLELKKIRLELTGNILSIVNFLIFFAMFELFIFSLYEFFHKKEEVKVSFFKKIKGKFSKWWKEEL